MKIARVLPISLVLILSLGTSLFASESLKESEKTEVKKRDEDRLISSDLLKKGQENYEILLKTEKENEQYIKNIFDLKRKLIEDFENQIKEQKKLISLVLEKKSFSKEFNDEEIKELKNSFTSENYENKNLWKKFWKFGVERSWSTILNSYFSKKVEEINPSILEYSTITRMKILTDYLGLNGENSSCLILDSFSKKYEANTISDLKKLNNFEFDKMDYYHGDDVFYFLQKVASGVTLIPIFNRMKLKDNDEFMRSIGMFMIENIPEEYFFINQIKSSLTKSKSIPHVINISMSKESLSEMIMNENSFHFFVQGNKTVGEELMELLSNNDILWLNSAGNDFEPTVDIDDEDWWGELFRKYPEFKKRMLFCGAIDSLGGVAGFSNTPGKCHDNFIYAPGVRLPIEGQQKGIDGTSFATPQVSGAFVLLKKYFPNLNMIELKEIVLSTTDPFPEYIEGFDKKEITGRGKLNVFKAFLEAYKQTEAKKK